MGDRTVYVGNVDAGVDEATLRAVFENCGFVTEVRIAGKKGYNTVYCFVEFAEISQAALALAMDGLQLGERQIKVSMAKITPQNQKGPENHIGMREPPRMPPMNFLQAQAQARLLTLQPPFNLGLLPFHQPLAARPLLPPQAPPPAASQPWPKRPHQDPTKVERTIYVENVAEDVDEKVLADHFGVCGEVTAVRVAGTGPGLKKAWVEFGSPTHARAAREYDQTGLGSAIIRVRPSKTAIHTNSLAELRARSPRGPEEDYSRPRSTIPLRRETEALGSPPDHRKVHQSPRGSPDYRSRDPKRDYDPKEAVEGGYIRENKRVRS